jgi:hypothetical protein
LKSGVTEIADAWIEVPLVTAVLDSRFAPMTRSTLPALPIEIFLVLFSSSVEFRYGILRPGTRDFLKIRTDAARGNRGVEKTT